jgi:poly(A) polymerase
MEKEKQSALDVLRSATRGSIYDGRLFLVGGYVRDKAMGVLSEAEDIDIVLEDDALALAKFLHRARITQIAPVVFPRFGTAMVRVRGRNVELVTARKESYSADSRKPNIVAPGTLRDDASRRDFTINTLLENLHSGELIDPTGRALADIASGIIRTSADPNVTFMDDPLRMMRAVRFAVRLGFSIDPATWEGIRAAAPRLAIVSRERVRDEFCKMMLTPRASTGLELLRTSGLLQQFAPELLEMVGVTQNVYHMHPVWDHTLAALDGLPADASLVLRLAVLLHDVGKPRTRSDEAGQVHFYHHQDVGAEMSREMMGRLKFSNDEIDAVVRLVASHMRIGEYRPEWSESAVRRLIRDLGTRLDDLFTMHSADVGALAPEHRGTERAEELRARIDAIHATQDVATLTSPLDGNAIMKVLGVDPGPTVRSAKEFLTNEVVEGRLHPDDVGRASALIRERFAANE